MHLITSLLNSLISQTLLFMVMLTSAENTPPVIVIKHLPVKNESQNNILDILIIYALNVQV